MWSPGARTLEPAAWLASSSFCVLTVQRCHERSSIAASPAALGEMQGRVVSAPGTQLRAATHECRALHALLLTSETFCGYHGFSSTMEMLSHVEISC